jgi:hypothetical protein
MMVGSDRAMKKFTKWLLFLLKGWVVLPVMIYLMGIGLFYLGCSMGIEMLPVPGSDVPYVPPPYPEWVVSGFLKLDDQIVFLWGLVVGPFWDAAEKARTNGLPLPHPGGIYFAAIVLLSECLVLLGAQVLITRTYRAIRWLLRKYYFKKSEIQSA